MKINKRLLPLSGVLVVFVLLGIFIEAQAGPYVTRGPFVPAIPGSAIPGPLNVPGKEYADKPNKDAANILVPGQSILWDGAGGIMNGTNYSPAGASVQVDAMANLGDALFNAVINNQAALLISAETDPKAPVLYEAISGAVGIWATANQVDQHGVTDLTALEVWGPEMASDANRYSLLGDPGGVSVFNLGGVPWLTTAQIAAAIGYSNLAPDIDLDALMVFGDMILFSIMPILNPTGGGFIFDGGEIWVWDSTPDVTGGIRPASFLNHGGHLWDTAFNVTAILGHENVDALEAVSTVPEPGTLFLIGLGLLGLTGLRRRLM